MKKIDFLPTRYHERQAAHSATLARWMLLAGLALGTVPLAAFQYLDHQHAVQTAAEIDPIYEQTERLTKRLSTLEAEIQKARGEAALLVYLGHPWPRTKVLAEIRSPLPQSVQLTSIRLAKEFKASENPEAGRPRGTLRPSQRQQQQSTDVGPPPVADLRKLAEEQEQHDHTVTLEGVTLNTTELHGYVARLRIGGLFVKSELRSLESLPGQELARAQKFQIRLVLAPGHGKLPASKTNSPSTSPAAASPTVALRP
jgi:hypothetical protein